MMQHGKDADKMKVLVAESTKAKDATIADQKKKLDDAHAEVDHLNKLHAADVAKTQHVTKVLKDQKAQHDKEAQATKVKVEGLKKVILKKHSHALEESAQKLKIQSKKIATMQKTLEATKADSDKKTADAVAQTKKVEHAKADAKVEDATKKEHAASVAKVAAANHAAAEEKAKADDT